MFAQICMAKYLFVHDIPNFNCLNECFHINYNLFLLIIIIKILLFLSILNWVFFSVHLEDSTWKRLKVIRPLIIK